MTKFKVGKLTNTDLAFIKLHTDKDLDWLSEQLNRSPKTLASYVEKAKLELSVDTEEIAIEKELAHKLTSKSDWPEMMKQYMPHEIPMVINFWVQLHKQFQLDVMASEEMQILDLIRFEILILRNGVDKANSVKETERLYKVLDKLHQQDTSDKDIENQINLTTQTINSIKASQRALSDEHSKLHASKQKLYADLKATRQQRDNITEDSHTTFNALLKRLTDEKFRRQASIEMNISKRAMQKSYDELTNDHKYCNDEYDKPILNADSVFKGDKDLAEKEENHDE